jgi:hypothetical protein
VVEQRRFNPHVGRSEKPSWLDVIRTDGVFVVPPRRHGILLLHKSLNILANNSDRQAKPTNRNQPTDYRICLILLDFNGAQGRI